MASTEITLTCHTDGCMNADVPIPATYDPEFGPLTAFCGPCGQEITDVVGITDGAGS